MVITCYNETEVDARAVNLTNQVGTITIVPVNFSYPSGSFRVESSLVFTHFTTAVTAADGQRVFKITGFTAVNAQVIEYYYELDYLKDYWFRYSFGNDLGMPDTIIKSWCAANFVIYTGGIFPLNTHVSTIVDSVNETIGKNVNVSRPYFIMMTSNGGDSTLSNNRVALKNSSHEPICPKAIYTMVDASPIDAFYAAALKVDKNSAGEAQPWDEGTFNGFYSNIVKSFYAPCTISNTGATLTLDNVVYYLGNDGSARSKTFSGTDVSGKIGYIVLPEGNGIITNEHDTEIDITIQTANDLPPYKKYQLYIPYIGWYEIPLNEIFTFNALGTARLFVRYYFDLINGLVSCTFGLKDAGNTMHWSGYQTPYTNLPDFPIPTSNYAYSAAAAQSQYEAQSMSNAISSLLGIGAGLVTGNILLAGAGIAHGITNQVNATVQKDQATELSSLGGFTSGRDSSIGQVDRQFKLRTLTFKCALTEADAQRLYGIPVNRFDNTILFSTNPNGKYWLDTTASKIKGNEQYVEGVRNDYSRDYITFIV